MGKLDGRVAVVTGCAQPMGIGAATAALFAAEGAAVALADLDLEGARARAEQIERDGGVAMPVRVDIGDADSVTQAFAEIGARFGHVDVLHNNAANTAAVRRDGELQHLELDVWDDTFRVNLRGAMLCMKAVIPGMLEQGRGSIVNTVSDLAFAGAFGMTAYASSKAGLVALTKYVAAQYTRRGIRCNAVSPGVVNTDNVRLLGPEFADIQSRHHLAGRLGEPDDIAHGVLYLVSDDASFVTGQVLHISGGYLDHVPTYAEEVAALDGL